MTHMMLAVLLVLNKADSNLAFVDPTTLQVMTKIATGNGPHEVAVSTDGKVALVANYGTGPEPGRTVSIIDIAARKESKRLALPILRPHGTFAIGSHIYFTAEGSRVVARNSQPTANACSFPIRRRMPFWSSTRQHVSL